MTDETKRHISDVWRYFRESTARTFLGVNKLENTNLSSLLGILSASVIGVGLTVFADEKVNMIAHYGGEKMIEISPRFGLVVFAILALIWATVAFIWSAYKFRVTPSLSLELRKEPDDVNGELHYRINLKNNSRTTLKLCEVRIVDATPKINDLPMHLHCMQFERAHSESRKVTINGNQHEAFDVAGHHPGHPNFSWKGVVEQKNQPVKDYELTLEASAEGVDKITKKLALRKKCNSFELIDLDTQTK